MSAADDAPPAPTRFEPPVAPASAPFWDASREQRLVLQWCRDCERPIHYPREACPRCLGTELEFRPASGRGVVYAASVMPKPGNASMAGREPYVVALVDLEEGVRMLSNVVGLRPELVEVGLAVEVTWEPLSDGRHLPLFAAATQA
ncbi:MAG: putative nucleic-acid-binding protein containing a Zn-ribbon [Acidimicrobiales bacterium]|nr:putative nucleic-acid-binding protein containing a Zn-ribbon [Acidimicrobiales bacterium]